MTTLEIGIAVAAVLVLLTVVWSIRSARQMPPSRRARRSDLRQRREERDPL
jgi:hypothetical protein